MNNVIDFLKKNEIKYKNVEVYQDAFSHMSYVNESKIQERSYERLEFLGDSILNQIVAVYIYKNTDYDQGDMTLLRSFVVKKEFLSKIGRLIKLDDFINIGKGERVNIITDSVVEDVFESLVAAIYLDAGYEEVRKFLEKNILNHIKEIDINDLKDFKTKLQELLQSESEKSITYKLTGQPKKLSNSNDFEFEVEVISNGIVFGRGKGKSKKEAEQNAARDAYKKKVEG